MSDEEKDPLDTHGSPELDADALKLAQLGLDPGPTFRELEDRLRTPADPRAVIIGNPSPDNHLRDLFLAAQDPAAMRVVEIFGEHYAVSPDAERQIREAMRPAFGLVDVDKIVGFDPAEPGGDYSAFRFGHSLGLPIIESRQHVISGTLLESDDALFDKIRDAMLEIRLKFKGIPRFVRIPEQWARVKGAAPHYSYWIRSTLERRKIFGTARGRRRARIQRAREARRR